MIIKAADYNVTPNCPIEKQLSDLFRHLAEIDGEKTLVFDAGDFNCFEKYHFHGVLGGDIWYD